MIEGKWFAQGSDISVPLSIRMAVMGKGRDALDDMAQQVLVYREGTPVGTARLWWSEGEFHMGDLCVLPEARGQEYGDLLVRLLLYKAVTHNAGSVTLVCPRTTVPFFTRYGFKEQSGETPFGGDTVAMRLLAGDICLRCQHHGA
ncbi:MAG: GNAT family N-acetyltransferase [Eubacteriales bacterium]|nr:GNAT family N-acetyltransferase [Eubacteriales bacterium]